VEENEKGLENGGDYGEHRSLDSCPVHLRTIIPLRLNRSFG
jgi:hypothetical protein